MAYGVNTYKLICVVCKEAGKPDPTFLSARKNSKACIGHREEYYRKYYKDRYHYEYSPRLTQSRMARARKRWFVNEHACEVTGCGYAKLTRKVKVMKDQTVLEISMCPKHLSEYRCGLIEPWTWVEKDMEAQAKGDQSAHTQGNAGS